MERYVELKELLENKIAEVKAERKVLDKRVVKLEGLKITNASIDEILNAKKELEEYENKASNLSDVLTRLSFIGTDLETIRGSVEKAQEICSKAKTTGETLLFEAARANLEKAEIDADKSYIEIKKKILSAVQAKKVEQANPAPKNLWEKAKVKFACGVAGLLVVGTILGVTLTKGCGKVEKDATNSLSNEGAKDTVKMEQVIEATPTPVITEAPVVTPESTPTLTPEEIEAQNEIIYEELGKAKYMEQVIEATPTPVITEAPVVTPESTPTLTPEEIEAQNEIIYEELGKAKYQDFIANNNDFSVFNYTEEEVIEWVRIVGRKYNDLSKPADAYMDYFDDILVSEQNAKAFIFNNFFGENINIPYNSKKWEVCKAFGYKGWETLRTFEELGANVVTSSSKEEFANRMYEYLKVCDAMFELKKSIVQVNGEELILTDFDAMDPEVKKMILAEAVQINAMANEICPKVCIERENPEICSITVAGMAINLQRHRENCGEELEAGGPTYWGEWASTDYLRKIEEVLNYEKNLLGDQKALKLLN